MAEWTSIPCPRCNSPQQFKPRARKVINQGIGQRDNVIYIKCTVCRYEKVLDVKTDVQLSKERRRERANNRKKKAREKDDGSGTVE